MKDRPAIWRLRAGAGGNQVPHPGQTKESGPPGSHLHPQPGQFRQSPGDQPRLGIFSQPQAGQHPSHQGNAVLHTAAQFHPHKIRGGIGTEVGSQEALLEEPGLFHLPAGNHRGSRLLLGDFPGQVWTAEGGNGPGPGESFLQDIRHQSMGGKIKSLGAGKDHLAAAVRDGRHLPGNGPHPFGRHHEHQDFRSRDSFL